MPGRLGSFLIAASTALVILGASILPFANPIYVRFEQDRTGVPALTRLQAGELDDVTTSIIGDLFLWQGDFSMPGKDRVTPPVVLSEREQAHMRDVRDVFLGFEVLVIAAIVVLVMAFRRAKTTDAKAASWRAVGSGARALVAVLVVAGAFAVFAFDAAFEVFHRLFFSAGSYTFDPRTDRLVQLFPERFWSDTAIAVGVVSIALAVVIAWYAARRAGVPSAAAVLSTSKART